MERGIAFNIDKPYSNEEVKVTYKHSTYTSLEYLLFLDQLVRRDGKFETLSKQLFVLSNEWLVKGLHQFLVVW